MAAPEPPRRHPRHEPARDTLPKLDSARGWIGVRIFPFGSVGTSWAAVTALCAQKLLSNRQRPPAKLFRQPPIVTVGLQALRPKPFAGLGPFPNFTVPVPVESPKRPQLQPAISLGLQTFEPELVPVRFPALRPEFLAFSLQTLQPKVVAGLDAATAFAIPVSVESPKRPQGLILQQFQVKLFQPTQ